MRKQVHVRSYVIDILLFMLDVKTIKVNESMLEANNATVSNEGS